MEKDLEIPTALFAAPATEIIALANSQIGFMNMFAIPLFSGVADIMPPMQYCVKELHKNVEAWKNKILEERARENNDLSFMTDGMFSPRSMSVAVGSDTGSPARQRKSDLQASARMNAAFNKNPFTRQFAEEGAVLGQYHSLPDIMTTDFISEKDKDPTQDGTVPFFGK